MPPRVAGIDRSNELAPLPLDPLVIGLLPVVAVGEVGSALDAFVQVVGRLPRHVRVARLEREPELLDEAEVVGVHRAHDLAPELHRPAAVLSELLDTAADPAPRLEHEDVRARSGEVPRRSQSGQAGTENEDVGQPASS